MPTRESGGGGAEEANEGRKSLSNDEEASTGERRGRGASTGRKSARRAFRRFVAAPRAEERGGEKSRTYERTMAYARRLATERDMEVRDVVWAPALWAAVANEWTPEQAAEALARLEGRGAELLMRRYAEKRRVRACEIIYEECLKRGYDDGAGEVAVEMAKVLEWAPGRAADAEVAWARILTARAGNVKARAEAMSAAASVGAHGMLSVVGLSDDVLRDIVREVRSEVEGDDVVCEITNFLFPQGRVVSGDKAALDGVQRRAQTAGAIKVAPLAVSGAFHTSRMDSASEKLREALAKATFNAPRVTIYSNVTGEPIPKDATPDRVRDLLAQQLVSPVLWEQTLKNILADGRTKLFELGPNSQIKSMTKRVSMDAWKTFHNVDVK